MIKLPSLGVRHAVFPLYITGIFALLIVVPVERVVAILNAPVLSERTAQEEEPSQSGTSTSVKMAMAPASAAEVGAPDLVAPSATSEGDAETGRVVAAEAGQSAPKFPTSDISSQDPMPSEQVPVVTEGVLGLAQDTQPEELGEPKTTTGSSQELVDPEASEVAYAGEQDGIKVPLLLFQGPKPETITSLVASGDVSLWMQSTSGGKLWFVPPADTQGVTVRGLRDLAKAGDIVSNPVRSGLTVTGADGMRLREILFDAGSGLVPMHIFTDLAARSVGVANLTHGGLRLSPRLEDTMIKRQVQVLSELGLSGQAFDGWPSELQMVGCWTASGEFIISRTQQGSGGPVLQRDDRCRS